MDRPPFRPHHGAAGGDHPPLLCDLPADRLHLSVALPLRAGGRQLHADLHRPLQLQTPAVRGPAISSHRHVEADRDVRLDRLRRLRGGRPLLARPLCQDGIHRSWLHWPAHFHCACDRPRAGVARDAASESLSRHVAHDLLLRPLRRHGAIHDRPRPRASLRAADPRTQLLSGRLLHSADGDARRRRLHVPYARRHAEGAVRALERGASASARGPGRTRPGRRGSWC